VRAWLGELGVGTLHIEPGSPWENGYIESFQGKLRDELLNLEIFDTLLGGTGVDRAMATGVQSCSSAQLSGLPSARPGGGRAVAARLRYAPPPGNGSPRMTELRCGTNNGGRTIGE